MKPEDDIGLCINSGSSSLKFALFAVGNGEPRPVARGAIERIGLEGGRAWLERGSDRKERRGSHPDWVSALETAFSLLSWVDAPEVTMVGHRVVHGGDRHVQPAVVDAALLASLKQLTALAPLHLPAAIAGIEAVSARLPGTPQVACFDTAFHASMPEVARRLPLPERFDREGIRRYGFHGISYEHVMSVLGADAPSRIVIAHLGNGSSLVAVKDGRSIDTTMGLTPAGGVLMGTRTGDLDPGVLVHLLRSNHLSVDDLERVIERESGLAGVGGDPDMQQLLERSDPRARLAVSMFAYAIRKTIGGFTAALRGIDLLVFTGGIGEHAAEIRRLACEGLDALGIELDAERNARSDEVVSSRASRCIVRVIPADEDRVIARQTHQTLRQGGYAAVE